MIALELFVQASKLSPPPPDPRPAGAGEPSRARPAGGLGSKGEPPLGAGWEVYERSE